MNDGYKVIYIVLSGLILLNLLLVSPAISTEQTEREISACIESYQKEKGLTYEEAKILCTDSRQSEKTIEVTQEILPVQDVEDDCIRKKMDAYGLNYNDAKSKCYPVSSATPVYDEQMGCIEKLQKYEGLSYDEAKRQCDGVETVYPPVQSDEDHCIKKYMDVYGLNYDEAKQKCYTVYPDHPRDSPVEIKTEAIVMIDRCGQLEDKLYALTEALGRARDLEIGSLKKDIEIIKDELRECEVKVHTVEKIQEVKEIRPVKEPGINSPCDEVRFLKETYEHLERKISYIKEMIEKGEMEKSQLDDYYMELHYLEERIEKMEYACREGIKVDESPCARLSKLEMIYKEINDKLQNTVNEDSKEELEEKLGSIAEDIHALKEKCRGQDLGAENVESIYDVERAYRAKQKLIVEHASEDGLISELQEIENEKRKLLEEFYQQMQELDLRRTSIIKKFEVKGGKMYLDDMKTNSNKLKVEVKDKDIEIKVKDEGISIIDGEMEVEGDIPLEYRDGMLISSNSGEEIKIMPSDLKAKKAFAQKRFMEIRMEDKGKPRYIAKSEERGRFIGIIPMTIRKEYEVSAENGDIMDTRGPWWDGLVSYE